MASSYRSEKPLYMARSFLGKPTKHMFFQCLPTVSVLTCFDDLRAWSSKDSETLLASELCFFFWGGPQGKQKKMWGSKTWPLDALFPSFSCPLASPTLILTRQGFFKLINPSLRYSYITAIDINYNVLIFSHEYDSDFKVYNLSLNKKFRRLDLGGSGSDKERAKWTSWWQRWLDWRRKVWLGAAHIRCSWVSFWRNGWVKVYLVCFFFVNPLYRNIVK